MILSIALLSALLFADAATAPKELPKDRQEEVSRAMLALQGAQLAAKDAQLAASAAKDREQQATQAYLMLQEKLRKEFSMSEGCQLSMDKTWNCPKEDKHDAIQSKPAKP